MADQNLKTLLVYLRAIVRMIWCTLNIMTFTPIYLLHMIMLSPFRYLWPRLYWVCEGKLYRWLMAQVSYWCYSAGYRVTEYGEEMPQWDERCLVVANHQSTADVPALMALLNGPDKRSAARKALWIIDSSFLYTPFGIIGQVHGDSFLTEGKANREKHLINLKNHLTNVFWDRDRRWVLVFPEGGFLYKRREANIKYAEKNNFPMLNYSVLPRTGAISVVLKVLGPGREKSEIPEEKILQVQRNDSIEAEALEQSENPVSEFTGAAKDLSDPIAEAGATVKASLLKATIGALREKKYVKDTRPSLKYLVDITIAFKDIEDPPGLHTICLGISEPSDIKVYYRVYKIDEIPTESDEAFRDFMYGVWEKKDKLLEDYYKTGIFAWGEEGRTIRPRWWKMATQHAFFIASGYLYCRWLLLPLLGSLKRIFLPAYASDWFWLI